MPYLARRLSFAVYCRRFDLQGNLLLHARTAAATTVDTLHQNHRGNASYGLGGWKPARTGRARLSGLSETPCPNASFTSCRPCVIRGLCLFFFVFLFHVITPSGIDTAVCRSCTLYPRVHGRQASWSHGWLLLRTRLRENCDVMPSGKQPHSQQHVTLERPA